MRTRRKSKPRHLPIGTISSGTLKPEDLIPAYIDALDGLILTRPERVELNRVKEIWEKRGEAEDVEDHEVLADAVDELTLILEQHVPDLCRFGSVEGDGAEFGVWPDWDAIEAAKLAGEELWHAATPPLRGDGDFTYWLQTNDHGNATLMRRAGPGRWVEVWAVV